MAALVRAALIGLVAVFFVEVALIAVLAVIANASGWESLRFALGPVEVFTITTGDVINLQMRGGIVVIAALAGLLNAAGAYWLRRHVRTAR